MKRLNLEQLKANGIAIIASSVAIKGGQMDKCHPKSGGGIPAEY